MPLSLRLDPAMWRELQKAARADERTVASLIRKVLIDFLAARKPAQTRP